MKNFSIILTVFLLIAIPCITYSQKLDEQAKANQYLKNKGEVYLKVDIASPSEINLLTKIVSVDQVKNNEVFVYANKKEFQKLTGLHYSYTVLPPPSELNKSPKMFSHQQKNLMQWDSYPTYQAYVSMMYQFQTDYPALCRIVNIGQTVNGHSLLFAVISNNVNITEQEPRFMYESTMHGNETTGYILMLRLIDYLLSNYGVDATITNMVNTTEIWINPDFNPDGTYYAGDSTVNGSIRYNGNNVDLNRNFPDFNGGPHPDGNVYQPETLEMMHLADSLQFIMSANLHTGSEVFNYVWDAVPTLNADDSWWQFMGRMFADTIHAAGPSGYFVDLNNGVTNGYAWYQVLGGRQDYMNYYHHCREVTIELSTTFIPDGSTLPTYWDSDYRSFLNYIKECHYGVNGTVTDSITGAPLNAHIFVNSHDVDNTDVYTRMPFGDYYRPIYQGTYSITYSSPGYQSKTLSVTIASHVATVLNVKLGQIAPVVNFTADNLSSCTGEITFTDQSNTSPGSTYLWNFGDGTTTTEQNPVHYYTTNGTFTVILSVTNSIGTNSMTQNNYITINLPASPTAGSDTICGSGSVTLTATGAGTLNWYTVPTGGTPFYTGSSYTTPVLNQSTDYYVENVVENPPQSAGKPDNTGSGGYFNNTTQHYEVFTCYVPIILQSVTVYASGAAVRTIQLQDSSGTVLQTIDANIPDGESVVTLNFNLPAGTNMRLAGPSFPNLYRNNGGCTYPYTLNGVLSITSSSAGSNPTSYYYYFYNWKVGGSSCISARTEATVTVFQGGPQVDFSTTITGNQVTFNNTSSGADTYSWDFGDGYNSSETNPVHTYSASGSYIVHLIAVNFCGSNVFTDTVTIVNDINLVSDQCTVKIVPNPSDGRFSVEYQSSGNTNDRITIYDITGRIMLTREITGYNKESKVKFNLSGFPEGLYMLEINSGGRISTRKLLIR